jgi:hypothetical protein
MPIWLLDASLEPRRHKSLSELPRVSIWDERLSKDIGQQPSPPHGKRNESVESEYGEQAVRHFR